MIIIYCHFVYHLTLWRLYRRVCIGRPFNLGFILVICLNPCTYCIKKMSYKKLIALKSDRPVPILLLLPLPYTLLYHCINFAAMCCAYLSRTHIINVKSKKACVDEDDDPNLSITMNSERAVDGSVTQGSRGMLMTTFPHDAHPSYHRHCASSSLFILILLF